jgi:hypothetical protein
LNKISSGLRPGHLTSYCAPSPSLQALPRSREKKEGGFQKNAKRKGRERGGASSIRTFADALLEKVLEHHLKGRGKRVVHERGSLADNIAWKANLQV